MVSTAFKNHCTNPKNSQLTECKSEADKETDEQADKQEAEKKKKEENNLVITKGEKNDSDKKK